MLSSLPLSDQSQTDTTAIQTIIEQQTTAWNQGDAVGYAQSFATDGTCTNIQGLFLSGHQTFLEKHALIFNGVYKKTCFDQKIVSLRLVSPGVAIVETLASVSSLLATPLLGIHFDAKGQLNTRILQVLIKEAGDWKITAYHNVDIKPGMPIPEFDQADDLH